MKRQQLRLSLQTLENRENPSGNVTATLSASGVLAITGDEASNNITINVNNSGSTTITANDGETITGSPLVGTVKSIVINMNDGDDTVSTVAGSSISLGAGNVSINMGDGSNTLTWNNLSSLTCGNFTFASGEGNDTVGLKSTTTPAVITGSAKFDTGLGNAALNIGDPVQSFSVSGGLTFNAKEGEKDIVLTGLETPKITATLGDGYINSYFLPTSSVFLDHCEVNGPVSVTTGYDYPRLSIGNGGFVKGVTLSSKGNADLYLANTNYVDSAAVPTGNIIVNTGENANVTLDQSIPVDSIGGNLTVIAGNIANIAVMGLKSAGNLSASSGHYTSLYLTNVNKTGSVTSSSKGAAVVSFENSTSGDNVTKKGGNVSVLGASNSDLRFGGVGASNIVNGNVTVNSSDRSSLTLEDFAGVADLRIEGTVTITGAKATELNLQNNSGNAVFNGPVSVTTSNPLGNASVSAYGNQATFEKNLTVKTAGSGSLGFDTTLSSEVKGDLSYTGGQWDDLIVFSDKFKGKNLSLNMMNGTADITIGRLSATPIPISGNLSVTTGSGNDNVSLLGVSVTGTATIKTGSGMDVVSINNSTLTGISVIDTGSGADSLNIGSLAGATQKTLIGGKATYNLGTGNDELRLGNSGGSGDTKSLVEFTDLTSKIDGGLGIDLFLSNSNSNLPSGQIISFVV